MSPWTANAPLEAFEQIAGDYPVYRLERRENVENAT
jgi:hypothetical protein